jgi:hypothetical protein
MSLVSLKPGAHARRWPRPELSKTQLRHDFFAQARKKIEALGLTPRRVCEVAGFPYRAWQRCAGGHRRMGRATAGRLMRAAEGLVEGLRGPAAELSDREALTAYRAFRTAWAPDTDAASTAEASLARRVAWYLVSVELGARPSQVAHLAGVTRAAATQWLQAVEDAREDAAFEGRVEACARKIMGRT